MEKLHQKQAEDVMQGGAVPDDEQIHNLLEKKAAGGELTEQENALLNIFTAAELDRANASAKMNTTVKKIGYLLTARKWESSIQIPRFP